MNWPIEMLTWGICAGRELNNILCNKIIWKTYSAYARNVDGHIVRCRTTNDLIQMLELFDFTDLKKYKMPMGNTLGSKECD
jgi:hypothetical protein